MSVNYGDYTESEGDSMGPKRSVVSSPPLRPCRTQCGSHIIDAIDRPLLSHKSALFTIDVVLRADISIMRWRQGQ